MIVTKADCLINAPDLYDVQEKGDKVIFSHAQDTSRIQEEVYRIKQDTDRGFTEHRTMQWTARIPALIYAQHPEFLQDPRTIDAWLMTEEGSKYRIANGVTSPKNPGKRIMSITPDGKVTMY